jgi:uncharacterized protein (TIGR03437 family)
MSRNLLFALSLLAGMAASATAQDKTIATKIFTEPTGLRFYVDGIPYKSAQVFLWPTGTKHTISIEQSQLIFPGTRWKFTSWSDSTGGLSQTGETVSVTADASLTYVKASFTTEYLLQVLFYSCSAANVGDCHPPGTVAVGGAMATSDVQQWVAADTAITLQAYPNPGFVFVGWGSSGNYSTSPFYTHTMRGPITFANFFEGAKRVTLYSDPEGLLVAPDRTPTKTPAEMDWAQGSKHVLGAVSPQSEILNGDALWVFKEWSNGGGLNAVYTVDKTNVPESLTARYVRGARASFVTNPVGLKLKIDGRDNWPAYNFVWGVGMKYQISAPAEQVDSKGRKWVFTGWSNGGPADQEVTILDSHVQTGFRLIANFEPRNKVSISTNPPGLPVEVNGKECRGTCSAEGAEGDQVLLKVPSSVPISDDSRYDFASWSDGGSQNRTYAIPANAETKLVANFKNMFRLTAVADPGSGAAFQVQPESADRFYETNTTVNITADVAKGYRFKRWDGDLTGAYRSGSVTMSVPRVVRALLDIAPYAEDAGVRNAAGETPDVVVAPGSIASILGVNLSGSYEVGPGNPLAQTIQGVTVRLQNRYLPLVFVSPQQINLQVPGDLAEGDYKLAIKWDSYPETATTMRVARNAPGLFQKKVDDQYFAAAVHDDGSDVAPAAPAKAGETVTLYGTGFGPYDRIAPDGFPLPDNPPYPLADTVEVLVGDAVVQAVWSGGVPGQIGTAMVRFALPQDVQIANGGIQVRLRINGRESNTVLLAAQ